MVNVWTAGNARCSGCFPGDDGNGRIGNHFRMKSWRIHHIDINFQVEIFGYKIS